MAPAVVTMGIRALAQRLDRAARCTATVVTLMRTVVLAAHRPLERARVPRLLFNRLLPERTRGLLRHSGLLQLELHLSGLHLLGLPLSGLLLSGLPLSELPRSGHLPSGLLQ
jgi:hypothetical protein